MKWQKKENKGFLIELDGKYIDATGKELFASQINVLTSFFKTEARLLEYTVIERTYEELEGFKIIEFDVRLRHREITKL